MDPRLHGDDTGVSLYNFQLYNFINSTVVTMRIGIEAERANIGAKTGVEHYAKQLILHLAQIDHDNSYILYLRTKPEDWFFSLPKNFRVKVMPFPIFWTQLRISLEMLLHPVDVLFIPASAAPLWHPKNTVVTIHDVAWQYFPETFTWFTRNYLEWSTRFALWGAKKIIAVSEATKQDILKFYNVASEKIVVVHHGYEQIGIMNGESRIKEKLPEKYLIALGTLQPRKNIIGLIDAFRMLKTENPDLPHKLVIAGGIGWKSEAILATIENNKDIVVYLNYISDDDRWVALHGAAAYVLPSLYEGFGMPLLEAFEAGTPVATSNISSMPEVAGNAAVYFNPKDASDIKMTLQKLLSDQALRADLIAKGKERLKNFSWEKCARETLEVFGK